MDTLHIAVCDNHVSSLTFITSEITKQIMNMNVQADVTSFSSGEDVMCRVSEGMFFDLYILNIEMPKLDGITLALRSAGIRRIRSSSLYLKEKNMFLILSKHILTVSSAKIIFMKI